MSTYDSSLYTLLRSKALDDGAGELVVSLADELSVPKFKKWLINCKARDTVYKDYLGRFKFVNSGAIVTVSLQATNQMAFILKDKPPEELTVGESLQTLRNIEVFPDGYACADTHTDTDTDTDIEEKQR